MKKSTLTFVVVAVLALIGAVYYYAGSQEKAPVRQRFVDTFDEEPSVSCSNLVLTAWSASQLAVADELKIAINDVFHSRGVTAPIPPDQFDELVSENDTQIKELFTRAKNDFYQRCEEQILKYFADCEKANSNQSDFLKCWVDASGSDGEKNLYRSLTNGEDANLPELPDGDPKGINDNVAPSDED